MSLSTDRAPPVRWLLTPGFNRQAFLNYWVRDTLVGLIEVAIYLGLRLVPTDVASWFGAVIVKITRLSYPASEQRARDVWVRLRPEAADPASVDAAINRLWRSVSRTMTEYAVLPRLWREGRIAVEGHEHLEGAMAGNRPVILAALHLGNWEVTGAALQGLGYTVSVLYLPPENRFEHWAARDARHRIGLDLVPAGPLSLRAALQTLKTRRQPFGIFIDDLSNDRVQAPALGRPLRREGNIAYAARLAAVTGAVVIPIYCVRLDDSARFKVTLLPPIEMVREGGTKDQDQIGNIALINAAIEPAVRQHLDQWFFTLDLDLTEN